MSNGLFWVCLFVGLEAAQYTVFGNVLQDADPLRFSAYSTGLICAVVVGWSFLRARAEMRAAFAAPGLLVAINLLVAVAWAAMLLSVRFIEPAVSYTIGAAIMPVTVWALARIGVAGATGPRNLAEGCGLVILAASALLLAYVVLSGGAGFVRGAEGGGGAEGAFPGLGLLGAALAAFEGVVFTIVIILSARLHERGVGPATQFGLRFVVFAAGASALVLLRPVPTEPPAYAGWWLAGLGALLIAPPLYALQRAIAEAPAMTVSIATAFGPVCIYLAQIAEGRFQASAQTLAGISIYTVGALMAAVGAWRAQRPGPGAGLQEGPGRS